MDTYVTMTAQVDSVIGCLRQKEVRVVNIRPPRTGYPHEGCPNSVPERGEWANPESACLPPRSEFVTDFVADFEDG
jgi:hypothetical protein